MLNGQLEGPTIVTGERLTHADFSLGAAMNLAEPAHYPIEGYREIQRWYATLRALPSWQKTLAQQAASLGAAVAGRDRGAWERTRVFLTGLRGA